jgi:ATP-dependent protease ClpP protease subunit
MNFKYIKNISEGEGTILLYSQIGDSVDENGNYIQGISGTAFAHEMQYLQDKCSKIKVRINSIGGSVLDGYSIVSAILNSKIPCDTYIDGLAASIAGVIAMAGKKCYMADYGTLMLHNPSGGNDQNVLDLVKNTLVTIFEQRTKMNADEISAMMDKETWLGAVEALNMGLVDEIVMSSKKIRISKSESLSNMALIYNKIINKKPNMEKVTNLLKLSNEADEATIVAAIEEKDNVNAELLAENEELKNKVAEFEAKEKEAKELAEKELENKAIELVENAIKEKKIEESEKEATIKMAVNNFEFVANMISKINNVKDAVKVFDAKNVVENDKRKDWTIRDWEKKDAKGLAKMKNETPELYTELYNKFYNKTK